jgi:hypothetical protein
MKVTSLVATGELVQAPKLRATTMARNAIVSFISVVIAGFMPNDSTDDKTLCDGAKRCWPGGGKSGGIGRRPGGVNGPARRWRGER